MIPQFAPNLPNLDALRMMRPIGTPVQSLGLRLPESGDGPPIAPPQWGGGPERPVGPYPVPPIAPAPGGPGGPGAPVTGPLPVGPYPVGPGAPQMPPTGTPAPYQPIGMMPPQGGPPQMTPPQPANDGGGLDRLRALLQMYPQLAGGVQ